MNQLTITAETKDSKLSYWNIGELTDFMKKNPDRKFMVTFRVMDEDSRKRMLAYYNVKILPEWRRAMLIKGIVKTNEEIDKELRSLSPMTESRSLSELDRDELYFFLDHVKKRSYEYANIFVEDPRFI